MEYNKLHAYIIECREFEYIDYLIKTYNIQTPKIDVYNLVLDDYNWLKNHNVLHDTNYFALKRFANFIVTKYYERKRK